MNHELYFDNLGKKTSVEGSFKEKINKQYGNFENFKDEFIKQTKYLVGSGYTYLVLNDSQNLEIINVSNQETPLIYDLKPIMNIDLWEHAYYLDYQNNRDLYVENFFSIVDFNKVSQIYEEKIS